MLKKLDYGLNLVYYSPVMPIRIDTETVREARDQFNPEKRTVISGVMSMKSDAYRQEAEISVSRGKRSVSVFPNPDGEGVVAEETDLYYDDELGPDGQLTGFSLPPRRANLVKPGDTFTTRLDRIVPGRPKEIQTTTFTVVPDSAPQNE